MLRDKRAVKFTRSLPETCSFPAITRSTISLPKCDYPRSRSSRGPFSSRTCRNWQVPSTQMPVKTSSLVQLGLLAVKLQKKCKSNLALIYANKQTKNVLVCIIQKFKGVNLTSGMLQFWDSNDASRNVPFSCFLGYAFLCIGFIPRQSPTQWWEMQPETVLAFYCPSDQRARRKKKTFAQESQYQF